MKKNETGKSTVSEEAAEPMDAGAVQSGRRKAVAACAGAGACVLLAGCGIAFALGGCGAAPSVDAGWTQDGGDGDAGIGRGDSVKVTTSDGKTVEGTVNADGSVTTSDGKTVPASEAGSNAVQITSDSGFADSQAAGGGSAPSSDGGTPGAGPSAPSDPNAGKTRVADCTTVRHDAVTHAETVVDQAEQIVTRIIFSDGAVFDGANYGSNAAAQDAAGDYQEQCALKGHRVSYSSDAYTIPAVTHIETVVDSPAWDEQVASGGHWA